MVHDHNECGGKELVVLRESFVKEIDTKAAAGFRGLPGTADLTRVAGSVSAEVLKKMDADVEGYREKLEASKVDHNAMDSLIKECCDLETVDVDFLKQLDESALDSMLKSQQSKRSRCKSKVMTFDNYRAMMVGAVAELLLRQVLGRDKSTFGYRRAAGKIEYNDEELEAFKNDQESLRKEIRNIQSKKSIAKSKANFDVNSERWKQLIDAEQLLKSLRVSTVKTVVVDEVKEQLLAGLDGQEISDLKPADAKKLLEQVLNNK